MSEQTPTPRVDELMAPIRPYDHIPNSLTVLARELERESDKLKRQLATAVKALEQLRESDDEWVAEVSNNALADMKDAK